MLRTPFEEGCIILGYADNTLILSRAKTTEEAIAKVNLQNSKTLNRVKKLGLQIAESKTGVIIFNANNMYNAIYKVRVNREEIAIGTSIKYLGLLLDKNWKFIEHFDYIEEKVSRVTRALSALMPNLRGPREKKRKLCAHAISSIINYGTPIWNTAIINRKIRDKLRRIQRTLAIRVIAGYRTISADAALLLARIVPSDIHAAYYRRVFLQVHDLKRQEQWNRLVEREIKRDEETLLKRQWQICLQRQERRRHTYM